MYKVNKKVFLNVYINYYYNLTIDFSFILLIYFRKQPLTKRRQKERRQLSQALPNLALL